MGKKLKTWIVRTSDSGVVKVHAASHDTYNGELTLLSKRSEAGAVKPVARFAAGTWASITEESKAGGR